MAQQPRALAGIGGIVVLLLVVVVGSSVEAVGSELLVDVEFDLSPTQTLADGYTAADSVNNFLASKDLKWLRYHVNLVSGKAGHLRMRTAHLMFKDADSFAEFYREHGQRWNALFDHFWVNTRRLVWEVENSSSSPYPKVTRTQGVDGGYLFQFLYSPEEGKEGALKTEWTRAEGALIADLKANPGFLERQAFVAGGFQSEFTHMLQLEFTSLKALTSTIHSKAWKDILKAVGPHLDDHATNILVPGADEALYWPAAGSDKAGVEKEL